MHLLIFDMDGVLLKSLGYHRALKETVRLAGISTGFGEVQLTDEQIAQFEALGISSEWHSSALCMAVMLLAKQNGRDRGNSHSRQSALDLEELFEAIAARPVQGSPVEQGVAALEVLAAKANVSSGMLRELVAHSESIQRSPTLNWFQELILGSQYYTRAYRKKSQFKTESYLKLYDQQLLSASLAERVLHWAAQPGHGAAIMTNRPSNGPPGFKGGPDAEMGAALVGLNALPIVGLGEISWLSTHIGRNVRDMAKPAWEHALAAILAARGWPSGKYLNFVGQQPVDWVVADLLHLQGSKVTVFEDTPAGIIAVQNAGHLLNQIGLQVEVQKIGIAEDRAKRLSLAAQGAELFPDIDQALASLDDF